MVYFVIYVALLTVCSMLQISLFRCPLKTGSHHYMSGWGKQNVQDSEQVDTVDTIQWIPVRNKKRRFNTDSSGTGTATITFLFYLLMKN